MKLKLTVAVLAAAFVASPLAASAATYTPLPAHVYAPYYETYLAPNTPSIAATAQASGAKYFTLAFLQSTGQELVQPGLERQLVPAAELLRGRHRRAARAGGDVIPSFGGYSADQGGTEIADSCKT